MWGILTLIFLVVLGKSCVGFLVNMVRGCDRVVFRKERWEGTRLGFQAQPFSLAAERTYRNHCLPDPPATSKMRTLGIVSQVSLRSGRMSRLCLILIHQPDTGPVATVYLFPITLLRKGLWSSSFSEQESKRKEQGKQNKTEQEKMITEVRPQKFASSCGESRAVKGPPSGKWLSADRGSGPN